MHIPITFIVSVNENCLSNFIVTLIQRMNSIQSTFFPKHIRHFGSRDFIFFDEFDNFLSNGDFFHLTFCILHSTFFSNIPLAPSPSRNNSAQGGIIALLKSHISYLMFFAKPPLQKKFFVMMIKFFGFLPAF